MFQGDEWLAGQIEVDGKKMKAAILDMSKDGIDTTKPGDMLLLDINGNGKFEVNIRTYDLAEMLYLTSEVLIGGKLYAVTANEEETDISLKPLEAVVMLPHLSCCFRVRAVSCSGG